MKRTEIAVLGAPSTEALRLELTGRPGDDPSSGTSRHGCHVPRSISTTSREALSGDGADRWAMPPVLAGKYTFLASVRLTVDVTMPMWLPDSMDEYTRC